jgi:hypothetical protein
MRSQLLPAALSSALLALVHAAPMWAQQVPVMLVGTRGDAPTVGLPAVNRVAASLGADAMVGAQLTREITQRYAAPPVAGDPLAPARERARAARRAWSEAVAASDAAAAAQALEALDQAAREMESQPEALDASTDNRRALEQALVFLAERHDAAGATTRAEDAMRRLAAIDPGIAFTASAASPSVQQLYARAVATMPRGALTVDSVPAGCTVVRDGRDAGTAPVELQDLAPRRHRIALRCGALHSLVHQVEVAARTRATLVIDAQLDAALEPQGTPALRYATASQARARAAGDLAVLGRALGVRRVFGVLAHEDRVVVVDVGAAAAVGEAAVTDGSRLRALVQEPVSPAASATAVASGPASASVAPVTGAGAVRNDEEEDHAPRVRRGGGVPAGALVIGGLGVAVLGVGVYGALARADEQNRAEQAESAVARRDAESPVTVALQWGGLAGGGVLLVTGVLVGVLAGGEDARERGVRASVLPLPGGVAVGGVF